MRKDKMLNRIPFCSVGREMSNPLLAKMVHNGSYLTEKRLRALKLIHNYGLKWTDGTTAAMRLFDQTFLDLFSWMDAEMGPTSTA